MNNYSISVILKTKTDTNDKNTQLQELSNYSENIKVNKIKLLTKRNSISILETKTNKNNKNRKQNDKKPYYITISK